MSKWHFINRIGKIMEPVLTSGIFLAMSLSMLYFGLKIHINKAVMVGGVISFMVILTQISSIIAARNNKMSEAKMIDGVYKAVLIKKYDKKRDNNIFYIAFATVWTIFSLAALVYFYYDPDYKASVNESYVELQNLNTASEQWYSGDSVIALVGTTAAGVNAVSRDMLTEALKNANTTITSSHILSQMTEEYNTNINTYTADEAADAQNTIATYANQTNDQLKQYVSNIESMKVRAYLSLAAIANVFFVMMTGMFNIFATAARKCKLEWVRLKPDEMQK